MSNGASSAPECCRVFQRSAEMYNVELVKDLTLKSLDILSVTIGKTALVNLNRRWNIRKRANSCHWLCVHFRIFWISFKNEVAQKPHFFWLQNDFKFSHTVTIIFVRKTKRKSRRRRLKTTKITRHTSIWRMLIDTYFFDFFLSTRACPQLGLETKINKLTYWVCWRSIVVDCWDSERNIWEAQSRNLNFARSPQLSSHLA